MFAQLLPILSKFSGDEQVDGENFKTVNWPGDDGRYLWMGQEDQAGVPHH